MTDDVFALTGTRELEPQPIRLVAGALTADLVNGNLRMIRHDGVEVLRAVDYIVRDRDWGTYEPTLSRPSIEQNDAGFTVNYSAVCNGPGGSRLVFHARITATRDGRLEFDATATPEGDFETARCGFCVLHPIVGLAGAAVTVEHVDGAIVETRLPDLIEPWQPFKGMRAITHAVRPGVRAECRMEGDTFEMEDQRNWSDASYKTYVRPLELPWPYLLKSGVNFRQKVALSIAATDAGIPAARAAVPVLSDRVSLSLGRDGPKLPQVGVVVYPQDVAAARANIRELERLKPQRLLFHFDPRAGHDPDVLRAYASLSAAYDVPATLECAVPCLRDIDIELPEIAGDVRDAGLHLAEIIVSPSVDRQSTPPGSKWPECPPLEDVYAAARRAFPNLRLGGGMLSYFTELNRKRVPAKHLDFITHCTCPIVHAADDLSVMQTLEALPFITRSVRAFFDEKPYRIGPSTIAMRQNPYGSATKDNPAAKRIAMASCDPRHEGLFAAAWSVGYAARVAPAGLEQLVLSGFCGSFGVLAGEGESVAPGKPRPLFHVIEALASMAGFTSMEATSSAPDRLAVVAARSPQGELSMLVANLTAEEIAVQLPSEPIARLSILDGRSLAAASGLRSESFQQTFSLRGYGVASLG